MRPSKLQIERQTRRREEQTLQNPDIRDGLPHMEAEKRKEDKGRRGTGPARVRDEQQVDARHQQETDDRQDAHEQDKIQEKSPQRQTGQKHMEGLSEQRRRPTGQLAHYEGGFSGYLVDAPPRARRIRPRPNHREESRTSAATQPVRNVIPPRCLSL